MSAEPSTGHEDMLALAGVVARNAQSVLGNIEGGDLLMAHGHTIILTRQLTELVKSLDEQVDQLPPPLRGGHDSNPYTDPLEGRFGDPGALRSALTAAQLCEHAGFWNWPTTGRRTATGAGGAPKSSPQPSANSPIAVRIHSLGTRGRSNDEALATQFDPRSPRC